MRVHVRGYGVDELRAAVVSVVRWRGELPAIRAGLQLRHRNGAVLL